MKPKQKSLKEHFSSKKYVAGRLCDLAAWMRVVSLDMFCCEDKEIQEHASELAGAAKIVDTWIAGIKPTKRQTKKTKPYIMQVLSVVIAFSLAGCATPTNPESWMEKEKNSCLPTAITFKQSLRKYGIWAEVFRYDWNDAKGKKNGHAMVAYLYPQGKNQLWTYDYMGSYRIRAFKDNVSDVAQKSHRARGFIDATYNAEYLK